MQVYICDCCGASSQPIPDSDENEYKPDDKFVYNNGRNLCNDCEELRKELEDYKDMILTKYRRRCNHEHNKETGQNRIEPCESTFNERPERLTQIQKMLQGETSRTRKTESKQRLNVKYECPTCGYLQTLTTEHTDCMEREMWCGVCGSIHRMKDGFKGCRDPYIQVTPELDNI